MCVMKKTNDYDSFTNCTENENDDIIIIVKCLLLSIPRKLNIAISHRFDNIHNS